MQPRNIDTLIHVNMMAVWYSALDATVYSSTWTRRDEIEGTEEEDILSPQTCSVHLVTAASKRFYTGFYLVTLVIDTLKCRRASRGASHASRTLCHNQLSWPALFSTIDDDHLPKTIRRG